MWMAFYVQDSSIDKVTTYNDSSIMVRRDINLQSANTTQELISKLDTIQHLKVVDIIHQRARDIQQCLAADKKYYLTFAALFDGDTTITDEVLTQITAERDSMWVKVGW